MGSRIAAAALDAAAASAPSLRGHSIEGGQGRIDAVPRLAAHAIRHHLRLVSARLIEARGMHGEQIWHCRKCQIDRRSASRAERARLHISAVANHVPARRLSLERDGGAPRERQVGSMTGAAGSLAVAALAVVHHHRLVGGFVAKRAAGASTGKRLAHVFSRYADVEVSIGSNVAAAIGHEMVLAPGTEMTGVTNVSGF